MRLDVVESARLDPAARAELRELWDAAFTDGFSDADADHAFGGVHVLARTGDLLVGHASAVPRRIDVGGRWWDVGYVEAVATRPGHQHAGTGTAVMRRLQDELARRWPLGFLSTGSHAFYERLGWERWRGPSYVRTADGTVRTPDEDDGLMVLRTGAGLGVDLRQPVTCEDRPGDAW